jgi:hypothetical protein
VRTGDPPAGLVVRAPEPRRGRPTGVELEAELLDRIHRLMDDGRELRDRFDREVRQRRWHPFVAADYERVLTALVSLRAPGQRFLEWGSATGVITIMADLLGFEAYGIELEAGLVEISRELAGRYESAARFAAGSFLPSGYEWRSSTGDRRLGTIGEGTPAYEELGHPLGRFDLVYAYPWSGEESMMRDLMAHHGRPGGRLLLHGGREGVQVFVNDS